MLGHEAMRKMGSSNILISGMKGLGVEVAKDVVLAGVKSVTIHDSDKVELSHLSSQVSIITRQTCCMIRSFLYACVNIVRPLVLQDPSRLHIIHCILQSTEDKVPSASYHFRFQV